jgi:hypothetical protein
MLPIVHDGVCFGILQFYQQHPLQSNDAILSGINAFTSRMVLTGVFGTEVDTCVFEHLEESALAHDVFVKVCAMGVFPACVIYSEVDWFFSMGLPSSYFQRFPSG